MLEREEYIEQAYFFRAFGERMKQNLAAQDLLVMLKQEILATTKLPLAIDFLASELRLNGVLAPAMAKLAHYFSPFQTFVVAEAERNRNVRWRKDRNSRWFWHQLRARPDRRSDPTD